MQQSDLSEKLSSLSSRDCFLDSNEGPGTITIATIRTHATTAAEEFDDIDHNSVRFSQQTVGTDAEVESMLNTPGDENYVSRTMYQWPLQSM